MESRQKFHNINQTRNSRRLGTHERQTSLDSSDFRRTPKWQNKQSLTDTTAPSTYKSSLRDQDKFKVQTIQSQTYHARVQYNIAKFTPNQNITELLKNFQINFKQLINFCSKQHDQLVLMCAKQYYMFKQVVSHYEVSNHLTPYFYQMHINSTNTKENLLKMLVNEEKQNIYQKQQNSNLKQEIKKLKKLIKCKDQAYFGIIDKKNQLQSKIAHMGTIIKSYEDDQTKFRDALKEKDQKIKQLQQNKQVLMKDLNQIEHQVQTLNFIGQSHSISSLHKKRSCKVLGTKSCKQKKQRIKNQQPSFQSNIINNTDEDLYRFLLIQADTIEQQINQDEDY